MPLASNLVFLIIGTYCTRSLLIQNNAHERTKIHDLAVAYAKSELDALHATTEFRVPSGQFSMFYKFYSDAIIHFRKHFDLFADGVILPSIPRTPLGTNHNAKPRSKQARK